MKVRCIQAFGGSKPGDVVEVPDGAAVSDLYFVPEPGEPSPPPVNPAAAAADKEGAA